MSPSIAHLLNRECEITPIDVGAADGFGGFADSEGSAVAAMCRIFPLSAQERAELERREIYATHVVYLTPETSVQRGDKIELQDGLNPTETLTVESVQVASVPDLYQRVVVSSGQRSD